MSETVTIPCPDIAVENDGIFTMWTARLSSLSVARAGEHVLVVIHQDGRDNLTFRLSPTAAQCLAERISDMATASGGGA